MRPRNAPGWDTLLFLARLLALAVPLYTVLVSGVSLSLLQTATAQDARIVLQQLGIAVAQDGPLLSAGPGPFTFFISPDSTAWKSLLFLFALMVAVPKVRPRHRLIGLAAGLPLLWAGNVVRVVAIVLVESAYGREAAMFTHDILWQFGLLGLVIGIWLAWLRVVR